MRLSKIGRKRPILYRGKFNVPLPIIKRLAAAKNHFILAKIDNFNGKVNQYYLTIDNILSAVIMAKEGTLTTTDHRKKITKFFKYLKRQAKARSIDEEDFYHFYKLWQKCRYSLYYPKSTEIEKIELFSLHLLEFAVTELARLYKSDETILAQKVDELLEVYQSEALLDEVANIHEYRQIEAERLGELYGRKFEMKFMNPWNFIDISLITDCKEIAEIIDNSDEIRNLMFKTLKTLEQMIFKIRELNFIRIVKEIADAKIRKSAKKREVAIDEAIDAATKHPGMKFRLALNFTYDSKDYKDLEKIKSWLIHAISDILTNPNKTIKTGWEIYKKQS